MENLIVRTLDPMEFYILQQALMDYFVKHGVDDKLPESTIGRVLAERFELMFKESKWVRKKN